MNRRSYLVASALVVALVAAACSDDTPSTTSTTSVAPTTTTTQPAASTITTTAVTTTAATTTTIADVVSPEPALLVWADAARVASLQDIGARFTADTGLAVNVVERDFGTIMNDVIQAGPGQAPDLFIGSHEWTGALADAGVVAAIDDLTEGTKDDFFSNTFSGFTVDGVVFGVPVQIEAVAMWMNTTLAGRTVGPADFEELRTMCDLVIDENRGQVCLALPGGGDSSDAYHQFPFTSAFGGSIFQFDPGIGYKPITAGINSDESVAGNTFMQALAIEEYMPSLDYTGAEEAFTTGRAMFWITGPWARQVVEEGASDSGYRHTVVPIPLMAGNRAKPFYAARGFFVGSESKRPAAAKQFLYGYVASAAGMARLYTEGTLPTHKAVAATLDDPILTVFLESAVTGQPTPNLAEMTPDIWSLWGGALNAIRNRTDVATALARAAQQINGILRN